MKKIVKIKIANGIKVTKRDNESHFNKIHFLITNYNKLWQNKLDQINYTKKTFFCKLTIKRKRMEIILKHKLYVFNNHKIKQWINIR